MFLAICTWSDILIYVQALICKWTKQRFPAMSVSDGPYMYKPAHSPYKYGQPIHTYGTAHMRMNKMLVWDRTPQYYSK